MSLAASHIAARILAGRPLPLVGRLVMDLSRKGEVVLLDLQGRELTTEDDRPAFVLSTEHDATDNHILRQHWDLSRADGAGVPILWNHNADTLYGQWQDLEVRQDAPLGDGETGPGLVGRAWFDPEDDLAQKRKSQVKRGVLNSTSVRWLPGEVVRRGDLDPADPLYREPMDDSCDRPVEGFVMGSARQPNHLVEASLTPIPADQRANAFERLYQRGGQELERALRSGDADLDILLGSLVTHAGLRSWARALVLDTLRALPASERAALLSGAGTPPPVEPPPAPPPRTIKDLFPRRS